MLIPDCRRDDYYNQKFLNKHDKELLKEFDYAVDCMDNFFNNLDVYFDDDSLVMDLFNKPLPESLRGKYEMEDGLYEDNPEERDIVTYGDLFRYNLLCWMDTERNEIIMSMIDKYNPPCSD